MIPARLLADQLTVVAPARVTSGYGDDATLDYRAEAGAQRRGLRGMLQPTSGSEVSDNGARTALIGEWLLLTDDTTLDGLDRLEFRGSTFEIVGPVLRPTDAFGRFHHSEARLREVSG